MYLCVYRYRYIDVYMYIMCINMCRKRERETQIYT